MTLLLYSVSWPESSLFALYLQTETLHYVQLIAPEAHACHMPTKYHLIGGSKGKYTKHLWLLYALGGVKKHHMQIRYGGNGDFHTTEWEISTSVFTV